MHFVVSIYSGRFVFVMNSLDANNDALKNRFVMLLQVKAFLKNQKIRPTTRGSLVCVFYSPTTCSGCTRNSLSKFNGVQDETSAYPG